MEQSEADEPWRPVTRWVEFAIGVGLNWPLSDRGSRRIALISMPCDSAAAALVALGAMGRRLSNPDANEVASHYGRLRHLATQKDQATVLRWAQMRRGRFVADEIDANGMLWVREISGGFRKTVMARAALEWWIDDEPPVEVWPGAQLPWRDFYEEIALPAHAIHAANLARSDTGVCLAGRPTGEAATRRMVSSIRFRIGDKVADASKLLSVHGWSDDAVSRVTFFNSRTNELNRSNTSPRLVIADGDTSFLKAVDHATFRDSDVIGVFHRALERDRLEDIGQKVTSLAQWYGPDTTVIFTLAPPPGISVNVIRRR